LTQPKDDVAREAQKTCQPYWQEANQHPPTDPSPSPSPHASAPASPSPSPEPFSTAVTQATKAAQQTQTAKSSEQWQTVAGLWQQAIASMQSVPTTDPHHATAQQKIGDYQKNLQYAQKQGKGSK